MNIVDSQVHLNQLGSDWAIADPAATVGHAIAAMDAVGVGAVLIDEWIGLDAKGNRMPGTELPNGSVRSLHPFSERAVEMHADRFGYVTQIDRRDPEMAELMASVRNRAGCLAVRVTPFPQTGELEQFEAGAHDALFRAAEQYGVPIFVWLPGRIHLLEPYLRKFSDVPIILDHCGLSAPFKPDGSARLRHLDALSALAVYKNLVLKWGHAPTRVSFEAYPFLDLGPILRQLVGVFGVERIMWASDHTQTRAAHSWAESLFYLRDASWLSVEEKEWILGRTARVTLGWSRERSPV